MYAKLVRAYSEYVISKHSRVAADTPLGQEMKIFTGHNDPVYTCTVGFLPDGDGKSIVTGNL